MSFKTKKYADLHKELQHFAPDENPIIHKMWKRKWLSCFEIPLLSPRCYRSLGLCMIYFLLKNHFQIDTSIIEAIIIGIAIGLIA